MLRLCAQHGVQAKKPCGRLARRLRSPVGVWPEGCVRLRFGRRVSARQDGRRSDVRSGDASSPRRDDNPPRLLDAPELARVSTVDYQASGFGGCSEHRSVLHEAGERFVVQTPEAVFAPAG